MANMYLSIHILIYVLVLLNCSISISGTYTETHWQTAVQITEYKSYASSSMLFFTVPELTMQSLWQLNAYKQPNIDKCEDRTVFVFLQPNSFPVISPLNETFPEDFNTIRTEPHNLQLLTNNETVRFFIHSPSPGGWYLKAFLGDYVDDSIKQKGFGTDCRYFMGSIHVIEALDTVTHIPVGESVVIESRHTIEDAYRFLTAENTWQYEIVTGQCTVNESLPLSPCPISLSTRALALPTFDEKSNTIDCSEANSSQCVLAVSGPATRTWHYVWVKSITRQVVQLNLTVVLKNCIDNPISLVKDINPQIFNASQNTTVYDATVANSSDMDGLSNKDIHKVTSASTVPDLVVRDSVTLPLEKQDLIQTLPNSIRPRFDTCTIIPQLGRFEIPTKLFDVNYKLRFGYLFPMQASIMITDTGPVILHFKILPDIDIGGTLKYSLQMNTQYLNDSKQVVRIHCCVQRLGMPVSSQGVACHHDNYIQVNSSDLLYGQLYFPYPEPGTWYITMMAECLNADNTSIGEKCRQDAITVNMDTALKPCVDGGCGTYGSCYTYYSSHHRFSSCSCIANYRGYGCTDSLQADSDSLQLASALLLTLSNLMFIPAIVISLYRRFFPEALSYTYTMFFSTFYHACDGSRKYIYCLMSYNVLSYCDFFGAIMSVWVTFVAMSRLGQQFRSFLFLAAGLVLAMAVTWDRYSLWTFAVPAIIGAAVMTTSWSRLCFRRKQCYPSKKRWLFYLVPGILIAAVGMVVYAFFETESNYWYTHSCWHACMALCIVFLLPPRKVLGSSSKYVVNEDLAETGNVGSSSKYVVNEDLAETGNLGSSSKYVVDEDLAETGNFVKDEITEARNS